MKTVREVLVGDKGPVLFVRMATRIELALGDLIDNEEDSSRKAQLLGLLKTFQDGLDRDEYDLRALAHAVPQEVRLKASREFSIAKDLAGAAGK